MAETIILASLLFFALAVLAAILNTQRKILNELKNLRIPEPQKIEFPKIEIPPAREVSINLNPVIEAIKELAQDRQKERKKEIITAELLQNLASAQNDLIKALQETSALMRVNQAEFQSGLEAFHKAIDKLLAQIPSGEKELDIQKEFVQKFEEAFVKVQETAAETMNGNSLRLQEILTEFLNRESAGK
jgi:type I site-specific restriction endonuclease